MPQRGEEARNLWAISNQVGTGFFGVSGMHLVSGRDFTEHDNDSAPKVAVINETMARHFFGDKDPIGQRIAWDRNEPPMRVAGVVRDIKVLGIQEGKQDLIFTPLAQT